jgi:hypothetical protein
MEQPGYIAFFGGSANHESMRLGLMMVAAAGALGVAPSAYAGVYQVGPDKPYRELSELPRLAPGDVVEVDGGAIYAGGVVFTDSGAPDRPITIRGIAASGKRPVIAGGTNTVEFQGSHYVFEGFEVTGGSFRCIYHHANDVTIRHTAVHDCPRHGLLGGDYDTGSLTLQYSEFYANGGGLYDHQIYMATNERDYPGAVFRMEYCYVHDANGGHNVKSRAERNEIYYNWIEGAYYHELELIGPDGETTDLVREDSDVVGNVLRKTGPQQDFYVIRVGGDGTGETFGRFRFVNNTILLSGGVAPKAVFRMHDGVDSVEMHNNVIAQQGGRGQVTIYRDVEANWAAGVQITGTNNWIPGGAVTVPAGWTGTLTGSDPGFANLAGLDLRPAAGSPLIDASASARSPADRPFPAPLGVPTFQPPARRAMAPGERTERPVDGPLDLGAFELVGASPSDEPPADEPPADEPPADEPPADEPPADEPPADEPSADEPGGGGDVGGPGAGGPVVGGCRAVGGAPVGAAWPVLALLALARARRRSRRARVTDRGSASRRRRCGRRAARWRATVGSSRGRCRPAGHRDRGGARARAAAPDPARGRAPRARRSR